MKHQARLYVIELNDEPPQQRDPDDAVHIGRFFRKPAEDDRLAGERDSADDDACSRVAVAGRRRVAVRRRNARRYCETCGKSLFETNQPPQPGLPAGLSTSRAAVSKLTLAFSSIALIAALLGFGGIAAASAGIAKFLFFLFLVMCVIFFVFGWRGRRVP